MKILFILEDELSLRLPGPTRFLNMIRFLEKNHQIEIIVKKEFLPLELKKGVFGVDGDFSAFLKKQYFKLKIVGKVFNRLIYNTPDYIITRNYYNILLLKPIMVFFRTELIYDMHCFRHKELTIEKRLIKSFIVRIFETLAQKFSNHIFVVSKNLFNSLKQKEVYLLPNGFSTAEFRRLKLSTGRANNVYKEYDIKKTDKIIGFIGNILEWMDIKIIIKAARLLPRYKFIVVGRNSLFDPSKIKGENIIFTGSLDHQTTLTLLKRFDICLLPYKKDVNLMHLSIRKSFEYLAAGKPIIMSDSLISEQDYLMDRVNVLKYSPEKCEELINRIKLLFSNKKLYAKISKNNIQLSEQFTWEKRILNSKISRLFSFPTKTKKIDVSETTVSIVIKALNEEKHIEKSIRSAILALNGLKGEVILVDSGSKDKTISIAKKFPIRILQLKDKKDACCGIGPQIGFLNSTSDFIYILDGDMELDKDFIKNAFRFMNKTKITKIAGIAGNIFERSKDNMVFQVRTKNHKVSRTTIVPQLGMGGLYKASALDHVGYFSNPFLYAYEEYDLAAKLNQLGYKLVRIPKKMIKHYGDQSTSFQTLSGRWKSRYLFGSGQYLKRSIYDGHFLRTLNELKIYVFTLFWILLGILSILSISLEIVSIYLMVTSIFLVILLLRKKNLKKTIFSLFSWSVQACGLFVGLFYSAKSPICFAQNIKIIKK